MHHQEHRCLYSANRVPTLLAVNCTVLTKDQVRIGEHARGELKINARMLLLV